MAKKQGGSFGSRKGVRTPAVMVQGNTMRFGKDPAPWFADFDSLAAQCTALTTSPAIVLTYIRNEELMGKVDRDALNESIRSMNELILREKTRLKALVAETKILREGAPAEGDQPAREAITRVTQDNTIPLLDHGEKFQVFMNDWLRVIFFAIDQVLQHFRDAGEEIPLICPASPGYVETEATMAMEDVTKAQAIPFNEIANEVNEEDHLGQAIVSLLQASPLKARHRKGFTSLLDITGKEFDKLVAGDYRQFSLTKLRAIYTKMELDTLEADIAAADAAEGEKPARGMTSAIAHLDPVPFIKSE